MAFQRFTQSGGSHRPKVTVTGQGLLSFNKGAFHRFGLADFRWAVLFWDADTSTVGVMLTNVDGEEGAVNLRQRRLGADIAAKSFLDFYEIPYGREARKFDPVMTEFEGCPMITLVVSEAENQERMVM